MIKAAYKSSLSMMVSAFHNDAFFEPLISSHILQNFIETC